MPSEDRPSFAARCGIRERERHLGSGYGFGIFVGERFAGEVTLSSIQRGPFQSACIGYWIDEALAGRGFVPEAVVVTLRFAFEAISLHRVEISIIPRNTASRRVVEKLGIRQEGIAERFLEIDGVWEDHVRYGITSEEWAVREPELAREWLLRLERASRSAGRRPPMVSGGRTARRRARRCTTSRVCPAAAAQPESRDEALHALRHWWRGRSNPVAVSRRVSTPRP